MDDDIFLSEIPIPEIREISYATSNRKYATYQQMLEFWFDRVDSEQKTTRYYGIFLFPTFHNQNLISEYRQLVNILSKNCHQKLCWYLNCSKVDIDLYNEEHKKQSNKSYPLLDLKAIKPKLYYVNEKNKNEKNAYLCYTIDRAEQLFRHKKNLTEEVELEIYEYNFLTDSKINFDIFEEWKLLGGHKYHYNYEDVVRKRIMNHIEKHLNIVNSVPEKINHISEKPIMIVSI